MVENIDSMTFLRKPVHVNSENSKGTQLTNTKKIAIKSDSLLHSNKPINKFHFGVHELLKCT